MKHRTSCVTTSLAIFVFLMTVAVAGASPPKAPDRIKAVMVGDRLVDVALSLGVIPEGMSVRLSMWFDMAPGLKVGSQVLGCPNYVTNKHPETIAEFMKERGINRLILEKSHKFCLYKKTVSPTNVAALVADVPGVSIEYVDFSRGMTDAIGQTAVLLGRENRGRELAAAYEKAMRAVEAKMPKTGLGRKVLILNGNYSEATGKTFIRIEAPGGYSDQYILNPLGCTNAAAAILTDTMKISKGHVPAGRLKGLAKAGADVIVATGDVFAVQKALHDAMAANPDLGRMPAIQNGEIYGLPFYGDSSVVEYPAIFRQWQVALTP